MNFKHAKGFSQANENLIANHIDTASTRNGDHRMMITEIHSENRHHKREMSLETTQTKDEKGQNEWNSICVKITIVSFQDK